jgi:predicted alpha/beta-hydrolase family hydrolase
MRSQAFEEGCTIFSPDGETRGLVLFLHGASQGYETPFMESILRTLVSEARVSVLTSAFDFFTKKEPVSEDLCSEVAQAKRMLEVGMRHMPVAKLFLVGKSLGGVIALKLISEIDPALPIASLSILGFPVALGMPPRMGLLQGKTYDAFQPLEEYRSMMAASTIPLQIIQGGNDDLGEVDDIKMLLAHRANAQLDVIPEADHSFATTDGKPAYQECSEKLLSFLTTATL